MNTPLALAAGTPVQVRLNSALSTHTHQTGAEFTGELKQALVLSWLLGLSCP